MVIKSTENTRNVIESPREGDWAGFRINFPQMRGQRSKLTSPPLLILTLSAKVHYLIVLRGVAAAWPPEELRQVKRGSPLNAIGTGVSKLRGHNDMMFTQIDLDENNNGKRSK